MMFLFLKNRGVTLIFLFLLISCSGSKNPVQKNNAIFLSKYSKQIDRAKKKHLLKAKESGIKYDKKTTDDLVDSSYYKSKNSRKQVMDDILSNDLRINENKNTEPLYLEDDLSIYYRNRTLKDEYEYLGYELYDDDEKLRYFIENKNDYSEVKIDFNSIKPTEEKLYGELKLRNNDIYASVGPDVILKNYDYLYVMDTVKKEIELKNKINQEDVKESTKGESNTKKVLDSLKDKFKKLLDK